MYLKETVRDFEQLYGLDAISGKFHVYKKEMGATIPMPHLRRDFFKITLVTGGEGILTYADKQVHIKGSAIAFFNPYSPYSWQPVSPDVSCYFCLFTDDFIYPDQAPGKSILSQLGTAPVFFPNKAKMKYLSMI